MTWFGSSIELIIFPTRNGCATCYAKDVGFHAMHTCNMVGLNRPHLHMKLQSRFFHLLQHISHVWFGMLPENFIVILPNTEWMRYVLCQGRGFSCYAYLQYGWFESATSSYETVVSFFSFTSTYFTRLIWHVAWKFYCY